MVDLSKYEAVLNRQYIKKLGRVSQVVGLTIESAGPDVNVGHTCLIRPDKYSAAVMAEVVGFRNKNILLMPLGGMSGIGPGSIVEATNKPITINVSDGLLGRVLDGLGRPMDDRPLPSGCEEYPVSNLPPNPLSRSRILE
ncbi:MAG: hypothetical protein LBB94_05080, partial [Clostridiales bacterium]|nr:hypothetical protein [Clostridiales bacterium]